MTITAPETTLALATIAAIIIGPITALWLQRRSEWRRDKRYRKLVIFKELMATRVTRTNPRHVDALNAIEVEFSSDSAADEKVLEAWRLYLGGRPRASLTAPADQMTRAYQTIGTGRESATLRGRWRPKKVDARQGRPRSESRTEPVVHDTYGRSSSGLKRVQGSLF